MKFVSKTSYLVHHIKQRDCVEQYDVKSKTEIPAIIYKKYQKGIMAELVNKLSIYNRLKLEPITVATPA